MRLTPSSEIRISQKPADPNQVSALVLEAMRGEMRVRRPLKEWEPAKFNPTHIQMVFDRALGLKSGEIAEKHAVDASRVSIILNHPYAERIMAAIFATMSERVTDPIERMKGFAHEMIDVKLDLVRDEKTPRFLRDKIAGDWLDRVGYGARRQLEVTTAVAPSVPQAAVSRLAEALEEAKAQRVQPYTQFLRSAGKEGQISTQDLSAQDSGKDTVQPGGASPIGPPLPDAERRTA